MSIVPETDDEATQGDDCKYTNIFWNIHSVRCQHDKIFILSKESTIPNAIAAGPSTVEDVYEQNSHSDDAGQFNHLIFLIHFISF